MSREVDRPHFTIGGHICAGCRLSTELHTGCVVTRDAKIVKPIEIFKLESSIQSKDLKLAPPNKS